MTITPDSIRRNLADLAGEAAHAGRSDQEIWRAAADRRDKVVARMDELRPKAVTDQGAAVEYAELTRERGQLDLVLGVR